MYSKIIVLLIVFHSLSFQSCSKKETDFKPQVVELKDEDLKSLLSAQKQELISQEELLVYVEQFKSGKISKEELKLKLEKTILNNGLKKLNLKDEEIQPLITAQEQGFISQEEILVFLEAFKNGKLTKEELKTELEKKIVSNGLKKKEISFVDADAISFFEGKENDFVAKSLQELMNSYFALSISPDLEVEKNGIYVEKLTQLRSDQDEEIFKLTDAINKKIASYDLKSEKSLPKMADLVHIHNYALINHLSRNNFVQNKEVKGLADLTVSGNPLEFLTHPMVNIAGQVLSLAQLQTLILEAAPQDAFKAYLPYLLLTGAKGQGHALNQALFATNQMMLLAQVQTIVATTTKYPSYVQIDHDAKMIHLNKLFFSLFQQQMGEKFNEFIKGQISTIYQMPAEDLTDYSLELDLDYDYDLDRV